MSMSKTLLIGLLFIFTANCKTVIAQNEIEKTPIATAKEINTENEWIASKIRSYMEEFNVASVSIGVIRNGEISYQDGFGEMKRGTQEKVNENSIHELASISKTFTGIIVNHLIYEGKLDLDEPITTYLSEKLTPDTRKRLKNIKLSHLMFHTSGISHKSCSFYQKYHENGTYYTQGYSEQELVNDLNELELLFEPGLKYSYSSSGYNIVGYICELVSDMSYQELLKKYITDRYHMPNTVVKLNDAQKEKLVTAYTPQNKMIPAHVVTDWGKAVPASGVYSNINDLSKLAVQQLKAYRSFLETGTKTPLIITELEGKEGSYYGLGMSKVVKEDYTFYVHEGDNDGFRTAYLFFPEQNCALVLFTSSGGPWMGNLGSEIYHKLIGDTFIKPTPKASLAQLIIDTVLNESIEAGKKVFQGQKESSNYYKSEGEMNNAATALMEMERVSDAIGILEMNVQLFPESAKVYENLGKAHMKNGSNRFALKNFRKSLALDPNNNGLKELISKIKQ